MKSDTSTMPQKVAHSHRGAIVSMSIQPYEFEYGELFGLHCLCGMPARHRTRVDRVYFKIDMFRLN
jgi:hypothetical protein